MHSGQPVEMTFPMWGLCVVILWTMGIVVLLIAARLRHLSAGGSVMDFGDPTGNKLLWRLLRSQVNCAENLPLYAGTVLILEVREVASTAVDVLAIIYVSFRILHSLIHIFGLNPNLRVTFLGIQFLCLLGLLVNGVA